MVLYTPQARAGSGGMADIENEIAFTIGRTNLAYANSNANHRLNLVYVGLASFNEPAGGVDSNALLSDLQDTSEGILDTVHGTRDSVKADLVSLIYEVDDGGWCGWGNTVENANPDTTDHRAFSVVKRSCAGANLSFPHEVGIILAPSTTGTMQGPAHIRAVSAGFIFGMKKASNSATRLTRKTKSWQRSTKPCPGADAYERCSGYRHLFAAFITSGIPPDLIYRHLAGMAQNCFWRLCRGQQLVPDT
ncbi:MAG: hypothetical protein J5I81_00620 [Nitrococcus mobilis]|nr:hypothetical protein [Nitrococcus mobilis]